VDVPVFVGVGWVVVGGEPEQEASQVRQNSMMRNVIQI
jgi:hypothetical protein